MKIQRVVQEKSMYLYHKWVSMLFKTICKFIIDTDLENIDDRHETKYQLSSITRFLSEVDMNTKLLRSRLRLS